VLRDGELFIAQAGWPMVYLVRQQSVEAFPDTTLDLEDTTMLGQRQTTDVRLFRTPVKPGDMILVADGPMSRQIGITRIGQILAGSIDRAIQNLETLAPSEDCSAMVIQIGSAALGEHAEQQWTFTPVEPPTTSDESSGAAPSAPPPVADRVPPLPETSGERVIDEQSPRARPPVRPISPPQGAQSQPRVPPDSARSREPEMRTSTSETDAGSAIGDRARDAFSAVSQGMRSLGERILPDRQPSQASRRRRTAARRQQRRGQAVGQPRWGIAAAVAIPLVALLVVGGYLLYRNWATRSQFEQKRDAAMLKRDIAIGNADNPIQARDDWLNVIALANEANDIQPDDPEVRQLLTQAADEIDRIDGVTRLDQIFKLYEYTVPGSTPSRIVVAVLDLYVLDRGSGRVYKHTLNEVRNAIVATDDDPVLIQEAETIKEQNVGMLVDIAWIKEGGDRQAGALLILDRNATLFEYDPTWRQTEVTLLGGKDVWREPNALQTFDANLYVLDVMANQIFKYPAQQYTNAPQNWLQAENDLSTALDIGIDGSIYILHQNGRLEKYFAGEPVSFQFSQMPQPLYSASALYLDIEETAQYIYIADAAKGRIVQLDREGAFIRQLCPAVDFEVDFGQLAGISVDETAGKIYYTAANGLYVADLPPVR
jgi:hypothetical protein